MQRLYRSTRDKKLTGLCGGLAEIFNIDPTLLRLVVAVAAFFSAGTVIFIYVIASMIIPKEPRYNNSYDPYERPYDQGPRNYNPGPNGNPFNGNPYNRNGGSGKYYGQRPESTSGPYRPSYQQPQQADSNIDEMMKEIEKKALQKEIDELRAKLTQMENNKKNDPKGDV
ncbi:PspC domain-containing protein [Paenibacillus albiflavus]|uniref:PspC domain-containing protein n=1 Tax=Paenibacillus albiflavus TaxID=2545760 RepID=A0A4R4EF57_9BACL|nr:PspC domain-containing protein [Paenibacillus albiflavus]TCZ77720.1 PspC domain-containing protein [Paenibacillus albiflavus]